MLKRRLSKHRGTSSSNVVAAAATTAAATNNEMTTTTTGTAAIAGVGIQYNKNTSWDVDSNSNSNSNSNTTSGNHSSSVKSKNSHNSSSVHTSDVRSLGKNTTTGMTVAVPKKDDMNPLTIPQQQQNHEETVTINNRRYPNGCLKKTISVGSTVGTTTTTATPSPPLSNLEAIVMKATTNGAAAAAVAAVTNRSTMPLQKSYSTSRMGMGHTVTTTTSTTPPRISNQQLQKVKFQDVYIREFERILGDNPSCSSGAPISLGWSYAMDKSYPIDVYEERQALVRRRPSSHGSTSSSRRSNADYGGDQLILSRQEREALLMEWGITFQEMIDVIRTNVKIKNQRRRTVNAIGTYDRIEEMMENTAQKLKRKLKLQKGNTSTSNGTIASTGKNRRKDGLNGGTAHSIRSYGSDDSGNSSSQATSANGYEKNNSNSTVSGNGSSVVYSEVNDYSTDIRTPASSTVVSSSGGKSVASSSLNTNITSTTVGGSLPGSDRITHASHENSNSTFAHHVITDIDTSLKAPPESALNAPPTSKSLNKKVNHYPDIFVVPTPAQQQEVVKSTTEDPNIPRRLLLQRNPSVESGITMDHHFAAMNDGNGEDDDDMSDTFHHDESLSTMIFNETEHSKTSNTVTEEETILALEFKNITISGNCENEMEDESDTEEYTEFDENMTIPSKFLHEFGELMNGECHPNQLLTTPLDTEKINKEDVLVGIQKPPPLQRPSIRLSDQQAASDPSFRVVPLHDFHPIRRGDHEAMMLPEAPHTPIPPVPMKLQQSQYDVDDDMNNNDFNNHATITPTPSMSELEYHREIAVVYDDIQPLSPISEFTGGGIFSSNSSAATFATFVNPPEDGNFDTLVRDSTFWEMRPGLHDAPKIQRTMNAVVITEDVSLSDTASKIKGSNRSNPKVLLRSKSSNTDNCSPDLQLQHQAQIGNENSNYDNSPQLMNATATSNRNNYPHPLYQNGRLNSMVIQPRYPGMPTAPLPSLPGIPPVSGSNQQWNMHHNHHREQLDVANKQYRPVDHVPYQPSPPPLPYPQIGDDTNQIMPSINATYPEPTAYIEPEIMMYNIVDGQPLYKQIQHHPEYNVIQNSHYSNMGPKHNFSSFDGQMQQNSSVPAPQPWEEHGFRVEPPPNSAALLNKMLG